MVVMALILYTLAIVGIVGLFFAFDTNGKVSVYSGKRRKTGYVGQHRAIRTYTTLLAY